MRGRGDGGGVGLGSFLGLGLGFGLGAGLGVGLGLGLGVGFGLGFRVRWFSKPSILRRFRPRGVGVVGECGDVGTGEGSAWVPSSGPSRAMMCSTLSLQ